MLGLAEAARTAPGLRGLGDGGIVGGIFSFIPQTLQAVASLESGLPDAAAALGDKHAQEWVAQKNALQAAQIQAQVEAQRAQSSTEAIKAWAPWVAIGLSGIGLTIATVKAFEKKRAA